MSHNVNPAEGYVLASYDQLGNQHQFQNIQTGVQMGIQAVHQHLPYPGQPEHQTLVLVSPSAGDGTLQADYPKPSQLLMVHDYSTPQNVIQYQAGGNFYQVPSYNGQHIQQQSPQDLNMMTASANLNFVQMPASTMNLIQVQNNQQTLLLANNNVILCLQPDDALSYELPIETVILQDSPVYELQDDPFSQEIAAKSWHTDSDIANRALMALNQISQGNADGSVAKVDPYSLNGRLIRSGLWMLF